MKLKRSMLGVLVSLLVFPFLAIEAQEVTVPAEIAAYPDLIVYNGKIVTMDNYSLSNSVGKTVQAMAVRGTRIQFLGSDQEVLRYAGPKTHKIDLKGRTVVPGYINTHVHLHNNAVSWWGRQPENLAKADAIMKNFRVAGNSWAEIDHGVEVVLKEQMAHPLPGQWAHIAVTDGKGDIRSEMPTSWIFNDGKMGSNGMSRAQLDKLAPKTPVVIQVEPGSWLINTAARNDFLKYYSVEPTDENEVASINDGTVFGRSMVVDRYFDHHMDELKDVLKKYLGANTSAGITTYASHLVGLRFSPAFRQLSSDGEMPIRLAWSHAGCVAVEPDSTGCVLRLGDLMDLGNDYYWNIGVNLVDTDLAGKVICTSVTDIDPKEKSQEVCDLAPGQKKHDVIYNILRNRFRFAAGHTFGDQAVNYLMDIMEQVMKDNPDITLDFMRSLRVSADHCHMFPSREQLSRMAKLGMITSCDFDGLTTDSRIGRVYGEKYMYRNAPARSELKAGVMPVAETESYSDYVLGKGPTYQTLLYGFLDRKNPYGIVTAPEEIIDRQELMKMSTIWAAHFVLREKQIGSLEPGKLADFLVLNKDYFTIPQDQIPTVFPLVTVLGGKPVVVRQEVSQEFGLPTTGVQVQFSFKRTSWGSSGAIPGKNGYVAPGRGEAGASGL